MAPGEVFVTKAGTAEMLLSPAGNLDLPYLVIILVYYPGSTHISVYSIHYINSYCMYDVKYKVRCMYITVNKTYLAI